MRPSLRRLNVHPCRYALLRQITQMAEPTRLHTMQFGDVTYSPAFHFSSLFLLGNASRRKHTWQIPTANAIFSRNLGVQCQQKSVRLICYFTEDIQDTTNAVSQSFSYLPLCNVQDEERRSRFEQGLPSHDYMISVVLFSKSPTGATCSLGVWGF